ncbi:MAG: hypothetical protein QM790_06460 [Nibricoccus sp.]
MRRSLIALLFAVAAALPCYVIQRGEFFLELSVHAAQAGAVVLYVDQGRGFNDDDQFNLSLDPQAAGGKHRFTLPTGKYRGLRVDFVEVPGSIEISDLNIFTREGALVRSLPIADFKATGLSTMVVPGVLRIAPNAATNTPSIEQQFSSPFFLGPGTLFYARTWIALPVFFLVGGLAWLFQRPPAPTLEWVKKLGRDVSGVGLDNPKTATRWICWATIVLAGVVLFARMPDRLLHPQFYAEDGYFYACALIDGAKALFTPYGGYLLTADRIIAAAAAHLPALYVPAFFNFSAFLVTLGVLSRVFSARLKTPLKPLLVLTVVMIPRPQDIFLTITNIQWVLALALLLLLFSEDAKTWAQHAYDCTAAVIIGLTGVFSVLLCPFFLWRAVCRKTHASILVAGLVATTAAVQSWVVFSAPKNISESMPFSALTIVKIVGLRLFCLPFGGPWLEHPWRKTLPLFALVSVVWALFLIRRGPYGCSQADDHRNAYDGVSRGLILAVIAVLFSASLYRYKDMLPLYLKIGYTRYFYLPQILFVWLCIFDLQTRGLRRYIASAAIYAFLLTGLFTFRLEPYIRYDWRGAAKSIDQRRDVSVPINPVGWHCNITSQRN